MILSKFVICGSKKSKFIKEKQAKGLLSNLGIRTPLNKMPLLGDILFQLSTTSLSAILLNAISLYKMNSNAKHSQMGQIINKFLLAVTMICQQAPLIFMRGTHSSN